MFTRYCEGDGLDDWAAHAVVRDAGVETLVVAGQVGQLQHGARGQRGGGHLAEGGSSGSISRAGGCCCHGPKVGSRPVSSILLSGDAHCSPLK